MATDLMTENVGTLILQPEVNPPDVCRTVFWEAKYKFVLGNIQPGWEL